MVRVKSGEGVCLQAFPSPPSPPSFIFLLSFHFSRGQNRKSHSSVFLCSETTRKLKKMNSRCTLSRLFHLVHFNNNIACKTVSKPEVQEKKKKVVVLSMCPRSPQNMKFGSFTSYVLWRQRNLQKSVMHAQSCCFANLNLLLFCRSRCRLRHRCLSSLLYQLIRHATWFCLKTQNLGTGHFKSKGLFNTYT